MRQERRYPWEVQRAQRDELGKEECWRSCREAEVMWRNREFVRVGRRKRIARVRVVAMSAAGRRLMQKQFLCRNMSVLLTEPCQSHSPVGLYGLNPPCLLLVELGCEAPVLTARVEELAAGPSLVGGF